MPSSMLPSYLGNFDINYIIYMYARVLFKKMNVLQCVFDITWEIVIKHNIIKIHDNIPWRILGYSPCSD